MSDALTMSRRDRLRRVVILCRDFARNLAYYRAGQNDEHRLLLDTRHPGANFWRVANSNCIDVCVLEWCKLFADEKAKHHWRKIVTDPTSFQQTLLTHLGIDDAAFQEEINVMRRYRDKFVAHLDSERVMNLPMLDLAKQSVWFYHAHIVNHEANEGDLAGLPMELDIGYAMAEDEANAVYRAGIAPHGLGIMRNPL
jgi:hypothetical protein